MKFDRSFFADLLRQALQELADRQGRDILFAAPLANHAQQILRRRLADENIVLNGALYGPALFPDLPPQEHARVKFRNFLEMFPDQVEVFRGPSGDMVRLLKAGHGDKVDDLRTRYRGLLKQSMQELTKLRGEAAVPAIQLAKWLKKRQPDFDTRKVQHSSLVDWLETEEDLVEVTNREFGGQVRLLESSESGKRATDAVVQVPAAYLVVDSLDILSALHDMLGVKPAANQLPDWRQLLSYLGQRFPASEWKGRYFISLCRSPTDSTEGLRRYLEAIGFKVIQLILEVGPASLEETVHERLVANRLAVSKMLGALLGQQSHVFVVSHSDSNAFPLAKLLEAKAPEIQVGVVGFPERIAESVVRLRSSGLVVIDIERDARLFKKPLARRQVLTPEDFDPGQFL